MEVFITFKDEDEAIPLHDSVKRWAKCTGASPAIIQVPKEMYEIRRRVLADNLAREDYYILADLLCVPGEKSLIKQIKIKIKENPDINMFGLTPKNGMVSINDYAFPCGVRVCKKGVVEKWPQQVTDNYNKEHAHAAKKVMVLSDVFYANFNNS